VISIQTLIVDCISMARRRTSVLMLAGACPPAADHKAASNGEISAPVTSAKDNLS
jgi:hypothetical protein